MINVTLKEMKVLNFIDEHTEYEGGEYGFNDLMVKDVMLGVGLTAQSVGGILSSLQSKDLLHIDEVEVHYPKTRTITEFYIREGAMSKVALED